MATRNMIQKAIVAVSFLVAAAFAQAEETWIGLFVGQDRLGYTYYDTTTAAGSSTPVKRISKTVLKGKMLGQDLSVLADSISYFLPDGSLTKQTFHMSSGGRDLDVTAIFTKQTIEVTSIEGGQKKEKTLPIPPGQVVKDDPTADLIEGAATQSVCFVFDPQTISLVKTTISRKPDEQVDTPMGKVKAKVVMVDDPRAPTTVFLTGKGDLIKAVGPFGLEMRPISKTDALDLSGPGADIAEVSTIPVDGDLDGWETARQLTFVFDGPQLNKAPSDAHQTIVKQGASWAVDVHPAKWHDSKTTIADAAKAQAQWTRPETHVPSNQKQFLDLAKKIIGGEKKVGVAAEKVRRYVHELVVANAGIGVVRDADEILATKEGVCRDHAVLMTAILRAAGIPTRVCAGIVQYGGAFYYHAWVEVWDGYGWVALDSTREPSTVDATHIKTAQGTVAQAFTAFVLDRGRAKVVKK